MRKWFITSMVFMICALANFVPTLFLDNGYTKSVLLIIGYICIIIQIICTVMVVITKNKEIDSCVQQ